jgi:hypothetical protein
VSVGIVGIVLEKSGDQVIDKRVRLGRGHLV